MSEEEKVEEAVDDLSVQIPKEDVDKLLDSEEPVDEVIERPVYGKELIMDIHNCSTEKMNREGIKIFMDELCELIDMKQEDLHFWDFETEEEKEAQPAHLKGTSAVQFITTSDIVIHTLDELKRVYLNVFSCKSFDDKIAIAFVVKYFEGELVHSSFIERD